MRGGAAHLVDALRDRPGKALTEGTIVSSAMVALAAVGSSILPPLWRGAVAGFGVTVMGATVYRILEAPGKQAQANQN